MKKVLLASTILAFSAGAAAAEMSLGGEANMGVKYQEGAADELVVHYEVDFAIIGSGETDNGLTFGASLDVDDPGGVSDGEVFVSGNFGTLTVGNVDQANDGFGIADIGFDGIGVDDDAESIKNAAATADINYEYSFGDFGVLLAADSSSEDVGIAFTYSGPSFSGGIGYVSNESTAPGETIAGELGVTFGDIGANLYAADWSGPAGTSATAFGVDVSYSLGALTLIAAVGSLDIDAASIAALGGLGVTVDSGEDFGVGASYDLGGGATLAGGVGEVNGDLVADFGITMSF